MNQSLSDINLIQKYEICRQQSQCYHLNPPPQPPIFPKLILPNSSLTIHSFFIIFGIFITLILTCLLLFLFNIKFQFYHKLRQRYRRTKNTDKPNIFPISYNSLTTTISQSSSLLLQQYFNSIDHTHSINIYEEIQPGSEHPHPHPHFFPYYQENHQLTPYYHTYDLSPSKLICQNCILETLHRKQQCLCHHLFVPIK